jgi:mono/diheme cytochrome c family protein
MRHFLANVVVYVIAVLIVLGAALFAWMRASQLVVSDEKAVIGQYAAVAERARHAAALGRESYRRNCANCHGRDGEGWDQYPGLAQASAGARRPGGRVYLVNLHLYGLDSPRWRVPMPRMDHLSDLELAAVLNYVVAEFGGVDSGGEEGVVFGAADVAERRGAGLSPAEVFAQR